jgi:signal transduction histidine kinase
VFLEQKDVQIKYKIIVSALLGLFTVFIPTTINLTGFNASTCEAGQGPLIYYFYFLEILFFCWLVIYLVKKFLTTQGEEKKQTAFFSIGTILFLSSFTGANLAGSLAAFINPEGMNNWLILQYGLFGMPVFLAFLTYVIVRYQKFNIKLILAQALVFGIIFLIGSQFAFIQNPINRILTGITLTIVAIFGWWLVKSVKKEILQREQLAQLLKQRETLVHLISHKVKGSFSRSKFIFDGMLNGIYGPLTDKIKEVAQKGMDSENEGIDTVNLVLNQANLQAGLVKYDMKPLDLKQLTTEVVEIKKGPAEAKGLKMETEIAPDDFSAIGDKFWIKEVFMNLVDNAVKYTDVGQITVGLKTSNNGKILFSVKDTSIGITDEDKKNLYTEGGRGKNSLLKNVNSTGYGLATVKMIVDAHKGKVWNESVVGKGSTFFVELPRG